MHESRLVADLVDQAERQAKAGPQTITRLRFHIGAMAPVTAEALRHGVTEAAAGRWGTSPAIEIESGHDPTNPGALGVALVAISVTEAALPEASEAN